MRSFAEIKPISLAYVPSHLDPARLGQTVYRPGAVVIDFEEAPPREELAAARRQLADVHAAVRGFCDVVAVRVNSPLGAEGALDCAAMRELPQDVAIVVAKPVTAEAIDKALVLAGGARPLWLMAEEAAITDRLPALHETYPQLELLIVGGKDLCEDLGIAFDGAAPPLREAVGRIADLARELNLPVVDAVAFGPDEAIAAAAARAQSAGMAGVSLIRIKDAEKLEAAWVALSS